MKESGKRRLNSKQFKKEAALLVTEHGHTIAQAAQERDKNTAHGEEILQLNKVSGFI